MSNDGGANDEVKVVSGSNTLISAASWLGSHICLGLWNEVLVQRTLIVSVFTVSWYFY